MRRNPSNSESSASVTARSFYEALEPRELGAGRVVHWAAPGTRRHHHHSTRHHDHREPALYRLPHAAERWPHPYARHVHQVSGRLLSGCHGHRLSIPVVARRARAAPAPSAPLVGSVFQVCPHHNFEFQVWWLAAQFLGGSRIGPIKEMRSHAETDGSTAMIQAMKFR